MSRTFSLPSPSRLQSWGTLSGYGPNPLSSFFGPTMTYRTEPPGWLPLPAERTPTPLRVQGEPPLRLRDYLPQAWVLSQPGATFQTGWHLDCLAEHLEACSRGELHKLLITVPPRSGKSLVVSVFWPSWEWLWAPYTQWLCASYAETLATRDAVRARRLMGTRWHQELRTVPWFFAGDQNMKTKYENSAGGHRIATSPGGTGTGEGGHRLVCDDPHNVRQGESEAVRESTVSWWQETMSTRGNDPKTTVEVVIQQRVHSQDLAGVLLESGDWHHLNLPMRYEQRVYTTGSPESAPQPHDDCAIYPDPRTEEGELLHTVRFPLEQVERLETELGAYATAAQFQQRPVPRKGALFHDEMFKALPPDFAARREQLLRVTFFDLAFSAREEADYTAAVTLGLDRRTQDAFILHTWRAHIEEVRNQDGTVNPRADDERGLAGALARYVTAQRPHYVGVWKGAYQRSLATQDMVRRVIILCARGGHPVGMLAVSETLDKTTRAMLPANRGDQGMLYADRQAPWFPIFLAELLAFPRGAHDDLVDATSGALALALTLPSDHVIQSTFGSGRAPRVEDQFVRIG